MTRRLVNFSFDDQHHRIEITEAIIINKESEPEAIIIAGYVQTSIILAVNATVVW